MDKNEKYFILTLTVLVGGLLINYYYQEYKISNNPVFVIGHMKKAEYGGTETGWVYDFEYTYNNQQYYTSIGGPIGISAVKDSLMYLKISADRPQYSRPVLRQWVPPCVVKEGQPLLGWNEIPYCK